MLQAAEFLTPTQQTQSEFLVSALSWHSSSCCGHLESESADQGSLFLQLCTLKKFLEIADIKALSLFILHLLKTK